MNKSEMLIELYNKLKGFIPRSWLILIMGAIGYFLVLPDFDTDVAKRFFTFFSMSAGGGWLALRALWPERTIDLENSSEPLRAVGRDICYAIVVASSIIGGTTASL